MNEFSKNIITLSESELDRFMNDRTYEELLEMYFLISESIDSSTGPKSMLTESLNEAFETTRRKISGHIAKFNAWKVGNSERKRDKIERKLAKANSKIDSRTAELNNSVDKFNRNIDSEKKYLDKRQAKVPEKMDKKETEPTTKPVTAEIPNEEIPQEA